MKLSHVRAITYSSLLVYGLSLFLLIHVLLAGRHWWWNLVSAIPGWAWLGVPLSAVVVFCLRPKNVLLLASILLTLPLALSQSDLQPFAGPARLPEDMPQLRVISWNSLAWRQGERNAWKTYLESMEGAEVIMLQEMIRPRTWDTPDPAEFQALFPRHRVVMHGEWMTATTLPVVSVVAQKDQYWLRVDVDFHGRRVSLYNVHIPVHINPGQLLRDPPGFFADMEERSRFRSQQFTALQAELASNTFPVIIAGDFNTTKSMGMMEALLSRYTDMARFGHTWFPATWGDMGLLLWRIDWILISRELRGGELREGAPTPLSDHRPLSAIIGFPRN